MKAGKKIQNRLDDRVANFEQMLKGIYPNGQKPADSKARNRMEQGGYTRPGSRKK